MSSRTLQPNYDEKYVAELFDQMGPTYDVVNLISSFGFSEFWRASCVANVPIRSGDAVADLMSGSGECWSYIRKRIGNSGSLISVDISRYMCERQHKRLAKRSGSPVDIRCESALAMNVADNSQDCVVSAFGLKTFNVDQLQRLAREVFRVLRPGGQFSFLEISVPPSLWLRLPYRLYIGTIIPAIGQFILKNIDCYRMLGVYTDAFGSCERVLDTFQNAGFEVHLKKHFFGCATSIIGRKTESVKV